MQKSKPRPVVEKPAPEADLDAQIARLREILVLMAPETGTSALGAMRDAYPDAPLSARVRALNEYRR